MSFDVLENPVTREYAVLRHPAANARSSTVADLYARPGAAVAHEHVHPGLTETFTVMRGCIHLVSDGREGVAVPGTTISVAPGTAHAWWNAGTETAWVIVEVDPGARFELMMKNMSFLAADGKTDARGRPGLLQTALVGQEFDDIMRLTRPPQVFQRVLFGALAPVARRRGLHATYPAYADRVSGVVDEVEVLPPEVLARLPPDVPVGTATGPPPAVR
jgi:quercetin dioxygenase-like cupin family protein